MNLIALADEIADVRRRIAEGVEGTSLDQYQRNAFVFISERLHEMENECRSGKLKPADERYPELGRIAVETDPTVLPPDLGGELIDVETKYQKV
jgi:hypothetical protein